jgi:hypothetical protein
VGARVKTIYTDKFGLYPWAMLLVSAGMFWSVYRGLGDGDGSQLGLGVGSGGLFLILALKRFWDIRKAKREGRDPTIVRIKENGR